MIYFITEYTMEVSITENNTLQVLSFYTGYILQYQSSLPVHSFESQHAQF